MDEESNRWKKDETDNDYIIDKKNGWNERKKKYTEDCDTECYFGITYYEQILTDVKEILFESGDKFNIMRELDEFKYATDKCIQEWLDRAKKELVVKENKNQNI